MTIASRSLRSASRAAASAAFAQRSNSSESPSHDATCAATQSGSKRISGGVVREHLDRLRRRVAARRHRVGAVLEHGLGERRERAALQRASRPPARRPRATSPISTSDGGEVGEPPRRAAGEIAPVERRRELDRAQQQLARAAERLARERALAGLRRAPPPPPRAAPRGAAPSSSARRRVAWSRWKARISSSSSPARSPQPLGERVVQVGARASSRDPSRRPRGSARA